MARRYFNVFKNHVMILIMLIVMVCLSELTSGTVSTIAKIAAGILMIYSVISYSLWLLKKPASVDKDQL
jgi:predicted CDP-diglyceride synthetase/phosphatidate cytidylyltransferase